MEDKNIEEKVQEAIDREMTPEELNQRVNVLGMQNQMLESQIQELSVLPQIVENLQRNIAAIDAAAFLAVYNMDKPEFPKLFHNKKATDAQKRILKMRNMMDNNDRLALELSREIQIELEYAKAEDLPELAPAHPQYKAWFETKEVQDNLPATRKRVKMQLEEAIKNQKEAEDGEEKDS